MTPVAVHFIVLPQVYLLDLAGVADALRNANRVAGRTVFDIEYNGVDDSVQTSLGLPLSDLKPLPRVLSDGALLIVAGVTPIDHMHGASATTAARWLASHVTPRHRLACVCAGAFLAARAGLLDGRACTTHHEDCDLLQKENPRALVQHNRIFVQDGHVMTSAGVTAGIDLALHLIAQYAGPDVALRVARKLVVYLRRAGADAQLSPWFAHRNHMHPVVHRAQDAIVAEPARAWDLAAIASAAHTSVRHLSRLFRDELGITVLAYLQGIRLAIARERLDATGWTVERVAEAAGFSSAHQLRRVWQRNESGSPRSGRGGARSSS
ncbi:MAG: helix-turn-helix domain-containing protein [Burkholderiaceae bacterium]